MNKYRYHIAVMLLILLLALEGCVKPTAENLDSVSTNGTPYATDEVSDLIYETRSIIRYDTAPFNSVKLNPVSEKFKVVENMSTKSIYEIDGVKLEIVNSNGNLSFTVNGQIVDNVNISRLLGVEVMFYDTNNDGKKDIIITTKPVRSYETSILLSKGSGYIDIGGNPKENIEIESKLLDDFKMNVVCRQYDTDMTISICDDFKAELLEKKVYDSNGKLLNEYDMSKNYLITDTLEYYEVDRKLVLVKKNHFMNEYCSTGCSVIYQYGIENDKYKLRDVKFVEENYNVW